MKDRFSRMRAWTPRNRACGVRGADNFNFHPNSTSVPNPNYAPYQHQQQQQQQQQEEQEAGQLDESYEPGEVKATSKGWVYINDNGDLQGPMELAALKLLASNGFMQEDHLVMRSGSNSWITLEHAQSPDNGSTSHYLGLANRRRQTKEAAAPKKSVDRSSKHHRDFSDCFDIDGRVEKILKDFPAETGNELKSALAALDAQRRIDSDLQSEEEAVSPREFSNPWKDSYQLGFGIDSDLDILRGNVAKAPPVEPAPPLPAPHPTPPAVDVLPPPLDNPSPLKWVPGKWTSKGGDWKLLHPEGQNYVKVVLNDGSLLCETGHYGADPRKQVMASDSGKKQKFELPQWAIERSHKNAENICRSKSASVSSTTKPAKQAVKAPGVKPPDHGKETVEKTSVGKPALPVTKKVLSNDVRSRGTEKHIPAGHSTTVEKYPPRVQKQAAHIKAKCNHDLARGDWYYKDGGGREKGPYTFAELQAMVAKEQLLQGTSVYRKSDDLWVPLPRPEIADDNFHVTEVATSSFDGARRVRKVITTNIQQTIMGFTSGQLHEHVMKHYKNQVMSAILFEGLDARLKVIESTRKLPAVELLSEDSSLAFQGRSGSLPSPSSSNDSDDLLRDDGDFDYRRLKRAFRANGVNHEQTSKKRRLVDSDGFESSDDELHKEKIPRKRRLVYTDDFESSDDEVDEEDKRDGVSPTWETLGLSVLKRVYHHLKGDLKSLSSVSMTCRAWRAGVHKFKPKVKCLDLSSLGIKCTDRIFSSLVQGYGAGKLKQIILKDCTKLTSEALGKFLEEFPSIMDVDINGCDQFGELIQSFPQINWVCYNEDSEGSDSATQGSEDSHRKMKSLKSIGTSSLKEAEDADDAEPMDIDPCYSNEHDLESLTQHSGFKRVKLNTGAKALKGLHDNGYVKGKKASERKTVTKKLNKLGSMRRTTKLEQDTTSTLTDMMDVDTDTYEVLAREWGARMTKAAMVPPVTRKYEVIEDYCVVIDRDLVERKMKVELPDDYEEKLRQFKQKRGGEYSHLDIPEIKDYHPRRKLGVEVVEQEVYGIDPYTHNLILDTMPKQPALSHEEKLQYMEEKVLQFINKEVKQFTGTGKAPIEYSLEPVIQRIIDEAEGACDVTMQEFSQGLLNNMRSRSKEKYVAYRKGLGVVCNKKDGFKEDDFVVEFFGEVYPAWRWYEKQDGCRALQKKDKDPAPEFYNILLERPKGDAAGYDLVVVDAMHKANFASRICHSCRPNCEAKVTAVNMRYIIGVYALRPIQDGEELTFDYNSVTESKEEYNNSICLCGSQICRGSYLNLANAGASQEVIKECHGLLDRHALLLEACCDGPVTRLELEEMKQAGVGSCLLDGLPDWLLKYTARLVEFMNLERQRLPDELMKSAKKKRRDADHTYELCRVEAENQAEGVYNQRLQNIAITLDKVRYVLRQLFTDPREAPPLLKRLDQKELVSRLWSGGTSIVNELLSCMTPHMPPEKLADLKRQVQEHTPEDKDDGRSLRESLLWLRNTVRTLEPTFLSRHDAAADLIHMYAYTQCFFTCEEYGTFESPSIEINSLDLGRHVNNCTTYTWKKTYNKEYVLGQLIYWFKQSAADPGASLVQARRGCLVLPDFSSCYAKGLQQDSRRAYGSRLREEMFPRMERWPQKQWPKSQFWEFKSNRGLFGSPMLDAVQRGGHPDVEMMHWLKTRPVNFVGPYDD